MSGWTGYLSRLAGTERILQLLADPADSAQVADAQRMFFMALASGWYTAFADRDRPDFVPSVNTHCNLVGTNPDFIYATASIDGSGQYLLCGERGDALFLLMDITAGGLGVMEPLGPSLGMVDFDDLKLDAFGRFSLMLSGERPTDWDGDWHRLDPAALSLSLRQASYDWGQGRDAGVAIERVDRQSPGRRWTEVEIVERLDALAAYPARLAEMALGFIAGQRAKGLWNRFEHDDWAGRGGVEGQHYFQGLFRLDPGKVLLLECDVPDQVRYWNVQLNDMNWMTIDWMNNQSSLNGGQASIDADGRFRSVIAVDDPGIANWLDTGGRDEGAIMLRFTGASSRPEPRLTVIDRNEIERHLPPGTRKVDREERLRQLRARRRGVQLRRRW